MILLNKQAIGLATPADENQFSFLDIPQGREWEKTGGKLGYGISGQINNPYTPSTSFYGGAYRNSVREILDPENSNFVKAGYGFSALVLAIPAGINDAAIGIINASNDIYVGSKTM